MCANLKGLGTTQIDGLRERLLPGWFDHLSESNLYKDVQFKWFCLPMKAICSSAENKLPVRLNSEGNCALVELYFEQSLWDSALLTQSHHSKLKVMC